MKNNKGFSLVELIVVIAIMAILAAVAIPTFATFITKAQVSNDVSFINDVTYVAKVSNTLEHAGEDVEVFVKVKADGEIEEIVYKVNGVKVTITEHDGTIRAAAPDVSNTYLAADKAADEAIGVEVGSSADWSYKFASVDEAGYYKLGDDGKTLSDPIATIQ